MAQSSTTISPQKSFVASFNIAEGLNFTASTKRISATTTLISGSGKLAVRDIFTTSSSINPGPFTVATVSSDNRTITVEETLTDEDRDGSTASSVSFNGFVTDKYKGDGYYSQADGLHTVAYHVSSNLNDDSTIILKMQGSLATDPTESDWFDIDNTTIDQTDIDGSTLAFSVNFTGNFVWVRAKVTGMSAGFISKILYNH